MCWLSRIVTTQWLKLFTRHKHRQVFQWHDNAEPETHGYRSVNVWFINLNVTNSTSTSFHSIVFFLFQILLYFFWFGRKQAASEVPFLVRCFKMRLFSKGFRILFDLYRLPGGHGRRQIEFRTRNSIFCSSCVKRHMNINKWRTLVRATATLGPHLMSSLACNRFCVNGVAHWQRWARVACRCLSRRYAVIWLRDERCGVNRKKAIERCELVIL